MLNYLLVIALLINFNEIFDNGILLFQKNMEHCSGSWYGNPCEAMEVFMSNKPMYIIIINDLEYYGPLCIIETHCELQVLLV
jgi:hypothetical protein